MQNRCSFGFYCLCSCVFFDLGGVSLAKTATAPVASSAEKVSPTSLSMSKSVTGAQATPQLAAQASAVALKPKEESIIVKARKREQMLVKDGGQVGILGNKKGLDVPFSIKSYTSSMILNQQSQTLGQVLQNDPAVRTTYAYGNFAEMFVIRGFPVYGDDVSINGLYGITPRQLVSPQLYDQVQVLTGANAFLNGAAPGGSVGGNINLLFKHAEKDPMLRLTGDYTSGAQGGGSVDMGRRYGDNNQWGTRLNIAGMDGETSIHHEYRQSVAIGFDTDYHTDDTRISLDINYQYQGVNGGRPALMLSGVDAIPKPVAPSKNFGQRWTYTHLNYVFGMLSAEHDFNKHITVYGAFGGLGGNEKGNYSTLTVSNAQTGDGISGSMYVPYVQTNESLKAGMRIHGDTGPIKHEVNLGMSSLWEEVDTAWSMANGTRNNLYHTQQFAQPNPLYVGGNTKNPKKNSTENFTSIFFSDTLSYWRIAVTGGFRWQNLLENGYDYTTRARTSHYNKDAITPVVGVVVHVTHHGSLYFNRIEGLAPGPQATGPVVNAGHIFAPYRTVQYEAGAKYDIGRWSANLAFYQMSQPSSYSVPYGDTGQSIMTVDGKQRNRGIELGLNGEIIKGLRFNGGSSITQAVQRKTAGGVNDGNRAVGVPSYTINGNLEYDLPFSFTKGVTLTGRVMRTGRQWEDAGNTLKVKGWTTFDLGARYTFLATKKHPMTLRFGVENLANHRYWSSAYGGYLTEGMPRTFKFSVTTDL